MSRNVEEVYENNPITVLEDGDLFYVAQKNGDTYVDGAISKEDLAENLGGGGGDGDVVGPDVSVDGNVAVFNGTNGKFIKDGGPLSASNVFASATRAHYTPTGPTIEGNLAGIDAALASASSSNNSIFWVSTTASAGGDGTLANPYATVSAAYAAGITSSAPFLVGLLPGAYFEPSTVLSLVRDSGFIGFDSGNTSLVLGNVTLDQTSWTTSGTVATFTLSGLTFSATGAGMFLSVPTFSDGTSILRDVVFKQQAAESYVWENFIDDISSADCDFSNINPKFFGCFLHDANSKFATLNVCTYDPDVGTPINNCRLSINGSKITTLYLKSQTGNLVHAILNSPDVKDMTNFYVEGDDITIWKSANVPNPTITSGSPTINNVDEGTGVFANFAVPTNYTPFNNTVTGHLQGIDAALVSAGGALKVYVTGGYQLVAPNTIYYTRAPGKVVFQIPVTFPQGSTFAIVGAADSQRNWELWTQLGQSLIYQDVITDLGSNIYATASSNYYRDTATFTCITADTEIQCISYDGAGLRISQETSIDIPLTTVTIAPRVVYAFGKIISAYTGYLAKLIRTSDSAVAYASPDFANRLSMLSPLDVGSKLIEWSGGVDVDIQMLDQSGNGNDATDSGQAFFFGGDGEIYGFNGRSAFRTNQSGKYLQAALPFFSNPEFTLLSYATRDEDSDESSIATLYAPGNGDDYASALDNVCFYENIPNTSFTSLRNGNLSTKAIPALNTPMLLANQFDGTNNTITVNRSNGTTAASSGTFSFNKLLMGGRYVSGGITALGNYRIACMILYPDALSGPEISDLIDYMDIYL